jgi:hypothetical protein
MDYSDYLIAKLILIAVGAAIYGAWRGWNGLPLERQPDEDDQRRP